MRSLPLTQRLEARAFALGLDSRLTTADRASHLARLAAADPGALDLAVRRIEIGPDHTSPRALQAIAALKVAATIAPIPPDVPARPVSTVA